MSVAADKPGRHSSLVTHHSSLPFSAARCLLLAALLGAPLAFGAVQPWAWASLAFAALLALLVWAAGNILGGELRILWSPLYVPAALFLLLAAVQYAGRLTFDPMATREALVKLAAGFIFFFLAAQLFAAPRPSIRDHSAIPRLQPPASGPTLDLGPWTLDRAGPTLDLGPWTSVYAFALGLFAILQFFTSRGLIYWTIKPRWGGWVVGPYVNHNHYAGLMEMLIPLAAMYALSRPVERARRVLLGFAVAVPIASLLLSGSRGGFLALLVEVVVFTAILWSSIRNPQSAIRNRQLRIPHSSLPLAVALALLSAALLFFWMDPGNISRRLATVFGVGVSYDELVAERREASLGALRIFGAHPGLGTGLGSFEMVFPRYRRTPSDLLWDHAHNDYAEALAETGLVGALLILWSLVLFFNSAFRTHHSSLITRHSSLEPRTLDLGPWTLDPLRLGATLGCIGLLVHSLVDFNLHIPANAAWFAFCAGLAIARGEGSCV